MMNYIIEKIQRVDEKIRLTKEEQHEVQGQIEFLDNDIARLEDELEECRQNYLPTCYSFPVINGLWSSGTLPDDAI